MNLLQDVFISYGRADSKHFAQKLHHHLVEQGFEVWFDFEDIPLGVDYQKQIDDGIEKADNFLFVIAPHSVNSPYCRLEVELALKRKKRIIPLLHVEQISRETWQQRNPAGTEAEWEAYQAAGKHSSFPNMHPAIGKINWVYFREGIDDFDQAFAGLLEIFARDRDYVHQHTVLLAQALEWEANQRQARYLLDQEARQQAEDWLNQRFSDRQPPCEPTVLHCEHITESIKHANGGMTDVFLSYAEEDKAFTEIVRQTLIREGLTVWTNYTDLTTGEEFVAAIHRGIETADNLIFILSPQSFDSAYCRQEVEYALQLNKRIIPLLLEPVIWDTLSEHLRSLQYIQYIDFCSQKQASGLEPDSAAVRQLFNILKQDAQYYRLHKLALHQALKWEQQNRSSNLLLRGNSLKQFEAWLNVATGRSLAAALPLQAELITESRTQAADITVEVFIAYAPQDADLARKLNTALQDHGKSAWFDQESIDSGADYQTELNHGIEQADNVLFIISPDAVASDTCIQSLAYADKIGKRIVPVTVRPVEAAALPPAIAALKSIDFQDYRADFYGQYSELVRTLESDREHVRGHTKWLNRAMEWQAQGQPEDMLLRGNELAIAETWLHEALEKGKQPLPTGLQKMFIHLSRDAVEAAERAEQARQAKMLRLQEERAQEAEGRLEAEKRSARIQKFFLGAVSLGFAIACGLSISTWIQYQRSLKSEFAATVKSSAALFASDQELQAVVAAVRARRQLDRIPGDAPALARMADEVLQQAIYGVQAINHLRGHQDWVVAVNFSPNGELLASASKDGVIKLWRSNGERLQDFAAHGGKTVWGVAFSPDSQQLVSGGADNTVQIWNLDGTLKRTLEGHQAAVASVAYSPDGSTIASASVDKTVRIWSPEGDLLRIFDSRGGYFVAVAFSPNGERLAAASTDGTITLWSLDGEQIAVLDDHTGPVWNVTFSPDGQTLASVSADSKIKLWNSEGSLLQTLAGHVDDVEGIAFSPDGKYIISGGADHTVRLWRRDGTPISILRGHTDWVWSVSMSPDGQTLVSGGGDNVVTLWRLKDLFRSLEGHPTEVWDATFSPDGNLVATAVGDGSIWLWEQDGSLKRTIDAHTAGIEKVAFSPDGKTLASASWDRTIKLWDLNGQRLKILEGHQDWVLGLKYSPDGQLIASSGEDGTVRLWTAEGQPLKVMGGASFGAADGVTFSKDGQYVAAGYEDSRVRIWDLQGNLAQALVGHEGPVYAVSFDEAGELIATAGADKTVRLWNTSGELLKTLEGHEDWVWRVTFSPDGKMLASAGNDRTIRLWDTEGKLIKTLRGHQAAVEGIRFSPDGKTLASASWDTRVILWNLEAALKTEPLAYGCDWIRDYIRYSEEVAERDRQLCD